MKLPTAISKAHRTAGIMLVQCLVYIAVFAILAGIGFAAFYLCWDQSRALIYATDDISSALREGERWRADVRGATGRISVETTAAGEVVRIPGSEKEIIYRFESGEMRREISTSKNPHLILRRVSSSQMQVEPRDGVTAWRWELVLNQRRPETQLGLVFTFQAAQIKP